MDDSSSDSESDCFESATESLDENEEVSPVNLKKYIKKSESKNERPVSVENYEDNGFNQYVKNADDNFVAYRKRPERVRADSNKPLTKETKISKVVNQNKFNYKTDNAPDIFLQDLTSNFSKNINKSFNSLQQTSSSVKDLILNSLPLSNVKESAEFSYDDKTNFSYEENICLSDIDNQMQLYKSKNSSNENYKNEKTKFHDTLNLSCKEEKRKISHINTESDCNENTEAKSGLVLENIKSIDSKSEIDEKSEKELLKYCNLENKNKHTDKNENVYDMSIDYQTIKDIQNDENSDSLNTTFAKEQLSQSPSEFKEKPNRQSKSCNNLFTKETSKKTKINKGLPNDNIEYQDKENSVPGMTVPNSLKPQLDYLFINEEKKIDEVNNSSINKSDHFLEDTAQLKSLENVEPLETFKNIDASAEIFDKRKQTDSFNAFDKKKITENLEKNFCTDKAIDTNIKNEQNCEIKEETITSKKDCVIPDQFEIPNEALINNEKINIDLLTTEKKSLPEHSNQVELQNFNSENDVSNIINVIESHTYLEESKCEVSKVILEHNNNIKDDVQSEEIDSSLVKEKEETDGWTDDWTADFFFNEDEEKHLKESKNNKKEWKGDAKNLEIKGKHLDTSMKLSTDSFSAMSEGDFEENDTEEIPENETKGPIDDWDWDTWDDEDDSLNNNDTTIVNKKSEVKKQEISDTVRWEGWDTFGSKPSENQSNWSLWGVNMLLNKATAVTQGISNVVEAGLGAPDPETFARLEKIERESQKQQIGHKETEKQETSLEEKSAFKITSSDSSMFPVFGLTNLVAGVTSKIVERSKIQELGSKVLTGGLDTLESFGKKTMEVLQEGDPGLKNKRALLLGKNKPILSQVLKEAKEKAEKEIKEAEEKEMAKKCHFEGLFDDFQGMVHLEALEMLSTQSLLKLEQIRRSMNEEEKNDLKEILEEVEQLCYLDEYDVKKNNAVADFKLSLTLAIEPLKNEISLNKMIEVQEEVNKWLENSVEIKPSPVIVYQKVVSTLAQQAAATIHQFQKAGELLSVKECRKTVEEIEALSKMTNLVCTEINNICEKFTKLSENLFNETADVKSLSEKINSVMVDSTSYIKQAFNLLIPILQVGAAA